ncbi:MAG: hypothetical protein Q4G10_08135, partial [Bacteroidia bacterium]|nr:hypothetical protein [Bacteroidia bacterium]
TLILLPIPGAIIYGLVSGKSDFAHSFVYGCIISLVFLVFTVVSAIKEKLSGRKARKVKKHEERTERAEKKSSDAVSPKPSKKASAAAAAGAVKSVSQAVQQASVSGAALPVSSTVRINAPDRKGEGRIALPEAQKKLLSKQFRNISMLMLCLLLIPALSVRAFAAPSVEVPDSADVAVVEDDDITEYEQFGSITFAYYGWWTAMKQIVYLPETVGAKEYTDADGYHVYHRVLHYDGQMGDPTCMVYLQAGGYAPGADGGKGIYQEYIEYQGDNELARKTGYSSSENGDYVTGTPFPVSQNATGAKVITQITSSEGDKVILELVIGECADTVENGDDDSGTVIHTDASDDKGEMPGFVIPAASAAALLGGGAVILKGKKKKTAKKDNKESRKESEKDESKDDEEDVSYEMRVYKEFGDTISVGDDAVVYARMVAVYPDGSEKTDASLTSRINIYPKTYLSLTSKQMSGDYMGAVVSAPIADIIPEEAVVVFDLEGIFKVEMNFKIGDCIMITDPATGAEEFYTEDRKTGEWVSSDGRTILNLSSLADWVAQRQSDREWIDRQNEKLRAGNTDFDRMLHEGDAAFEAEQRKIEEETAQILNNLRKYGTMDTDEAHIREIIARDQRLHASEARRSARHAVIYNMALWGATVTKYGADKAFDLFANFGGAVGKVGKAIYVISSDQAGAIEDARVFGKSKAEASGKAFVGSLYSIGKDYVGKGSGKVIYVIGGRAAEAAANAAIEGKSGREIMNAVDESVAKSSFELVTEVVGDTLGDMAGGESGIRMNGKEVYNITVGDSDIVSTAFNDITASAYDSSASALDESIDAYKKRKGNKR